MGIKMLELPEMNTFSVLVLFVYWLGLKVAMNILSRLQAVVDRLDCIVPFWMNVCFSLKITSVHATSAIIFHMLYPSNQKCEVCKPHIEEHSGNWSCQLSCQGLEWSAKCLSWLLSVLYQELWFCFPFIILCGNGLTLCQMFIIRVSRAWCFPPFGRVFYFIRAFILPLASYNRLLLRMHL